MKIFISDFVCGMNPNSVLLSPTSFELCKLNIWLVWLVQPCTDRPIFDAPFYRYMQSPSLYGGLEHVDCSQQRELASVETGFGLCMHMSNTLNCVCNEPLNLSVL